jgi:glycerol uptake facilitator-like aquaporin
MKFSLAQRVGAEFLGTAFLVTAVVGSGIMGERLSAGNVAIALLANSIATGAALIALINTFGPISGAHFNPVVTISVALSGSLRPSETVSHLAAQFIGGIAGTISANLMFGLPMISYSQHVRSGPAQLYSEVVATFGLMAVIASCARLRPDAIPTAVGCYIAGAYWFTSSTSFANPAVTVARCFTDTFAGIRAVDVPGFVLAQLAGAMAAFLFFCWLVPAPISAENAASR